MTLDVSFSAITEIDLLEIIPGLGLHVPIRQGELAEFREREHLLRIHE
jgi:hypothetical protein